MVFSKNEKSIINYFINRKTFTINDYINENLIRDLQLTPGKYGGKSDLEFNVRGNNYIIKRGSQKNVISFDNQGISNPATEKPSPPKSRKFIKLILNFFAKWFVGTRRKNAGETDVLNQFRSKLITFINLWKKLEDHALIKSIPLYRTALDNDEHLPLIIIKDGNSENADIETYCLLAEYIEKSIIVMPELDAFVSRGYHTEEEANTHRRLKFMYCTVIVGIASFIASGVKDLLDIQEKHVKIYYSTSFLIGAIIVISIIIYRDKFHS
jgi:hypothetical protein